MLTSSRIALAMVGLCSTLLACAPKVKQPPPDCTPLDPTNQATLPAMTNGTYPEMINVVDSDEGHGTSYSWADGQGYVLAPIDKVWEALQQPGVVADRRELETTDGGFVVTKSGFDKTCDWSFDMQCTTSEATGLSFPYDVQWRGAHTSGTATDPTAAIVCGDLTQSGTLAGSNLMSILSDSIILTPISDTVTQYSAIRHRGPLQDSGANCKQFVLDVFGSVVATVHGQPLPPDQN